MSTSGGLETALNTYKNNYAAYKVSGNEAYKTAYENALAAATKIVRESSAAADSNDQYIQNFLDSYENSNHEITKLHSESKRIKEQGPKLQDELIRSKQLHQQEIQAVNDSYLYIKGGLVIGLLIIVGIVGAL